MRSYCEEANKNPVVRMLIARRNLPHGSAGRPCVLNAQKERRQLGLLKRSHRGNFFNFSLTFYLARS
jgi:hypothetical protein